MIVGTITFGNLDRERATLDLIDQRTGLVVEAGIPLRDVPRRKAQLENAAAADTTATAAKVGRKQRRERVKEQW
jgi:hypothetical protein